MTHILFFFTNSPWASSGLGVRLTSDLLTDLRLRLISAWYRPQASTGLDVHFLSQKSLKLAENVACLTTPNWEGKRTVHVPHNLRLTLWERERNDPPTVRERTIPQLWGIEHKKRIIFFSTKSFDAYKLLDCNGVAVLKPAVWGPCRPLDVRNLEGNFQVSDQKTDFRSP